MVLTYYELDIGYRYNLVSTFSNLTINLPSLRDFLSNISRGCTLPQDISPRYIKLTLEEETYKIVIPSVLLYQSILADLNQIGAKDIEIVGEKVKSYKLRLVL